MSYDRDQNRVSIQDVFDNKKPLTSERPLNPGSCHATEFKFLPLERGFLHIDSIRVMDMTSSETVDITDLPDIKALDRVFVE